MNLASFRIDRSAKANTDGSRSPDFGDQTSGQIKHGLILIGSIGISRRKETAVRQPLS
jgi:hypothetical protein